MRKLNFFFSALLFVLFFSINSYALPVHVIASNRTGDDNTLGEAFYKINRGFYTGDIIIQIVSTTDEFIFPATLNSSGSGSSPSISFYKSVLIYPINDNVQINGQSDAGLGVIQLNGADNVTINGDNPNSPNTNRDLTINNSHPTSTLIGTSVIRVAVSNAVTTANNISIVNCNLNGSVINGNTSYITSNTTSSSISFGIYCGGKGGALFQTDPPDKITSATADAAPPSTTTASLLIGNNKINQCARGIVINGSTPAQFTNLMIVGNIIGYDQRDLSIITPPYTFPNTTVYEKGIWIKGATGINLLSNTIQNIISYTASSISGIELVAPIGSNSTTIDRNIIKTVCHNTATTGQPTEGIIAQGGTGNFYILDNQVSNIQQLGYSSAAGISAGYSGNQAQIIRNQIKKVYNRNVYTYGAYGINITSGSNTEIINNSILDLKNDITIGSAFSLTFGVHGIRLGGGTNHKVYHNTVNLSGQLLGGAGSEILTSAFSIVNGTSIDADVRNNIFSNTLSGGTNDIAHVSIYLSPIGPASIQLNNNAYYSGTSSTTQGIAQVGLVPHIRFYLAGNFNPASVQPSTNLRNYTDLLYSFGGNDNASFASTNAAPFATDGFHINAGFTPTKLESGGASVGVNKDIEFDDRPGPAYSENGGATAPDIGCDEFDGVPITGRNINLLASLPGQACVEDIIVEFRNENLPDLNLISPVPTTLSINGLALVNIANIPYDTPGYIVLKHKNSLETWSNLVNINPGMTYSFKTFRSQAYCSNQQLYNGVPSIYRGDFNQDDVIDVDDYNRINNDIISFVPLNLDTDLDCDGFVTAGDVAIMYNSSSLFYPIIVSDYHDITPNAFINRPVFPNYFYEDCDVH